MFFERAIEVKKVREKLSVNQTPVDEDIFCSSLSNGRVESFDNLNSKEFKELKRLIDAFTHRQLLEGIYSIAAELKVIYGKDITEKNDQRIIDYLKSFGVINKSNQFKLRNPKGDVIAFKTPLKSQSFYSLSLFSLLISQVYCIRSAAVN